MLKRCEKLKMSLYELFLDKFQAEYDKKSNDLYEPIEQLILIVRTHDKHFFTKSNIVFPSIY